MSNRAFLRELKRVDPKALMKKAMTCNFVFPPNIDGSLDSCAALARWFFRGMFLCTDHANVMLGAARVEAKP